MNKAKETAGGPPPQKARLPYTEPGWVEQVLCLQFPEHHSHQCFCEFTADERLSLLGPGGCRGAFPLCGVWAAALSPRSHCPAPERRASFPCRALATGLPPRWIRKGEEEEEGAEKALVDAAGCRDSLENAKRAGD